MEERKKEEQPEEKQTDDIVFLKGDIDKERVSVDLNVKRYSNYIFPHHRVKNLDKVRSFELGSGKLVITPSVGEKAPTIACFRVFIILLALAHQQGLQTNKVFFTSRLIARILNTPMKGDFAKRLANYLNSLSMTTFKWFQSFETANGTRETIKNFHLIESFDYETYKERVAQKKQFDGKYSVRINQDIFENLKSGRFSFVNLASLLEFQSGLSEVFYLRVDSILCTKEYSIKPIELKSDTIIKALQLDDVTEYKQVARRKRVLSTIQKECNDKILSNGNALKVELLPTADGKDWKLKCSQETGKNKPLQKLSLPPANTDPDLIGYLADLITEATNQPKHRKWHERVAQHCPQHLIMQALSELRQEPPEDMRNPGAVFTAKLRTIMERAGLPWIKPERNRPT
jgi:hypothetical protein